MAKDGFKVIDSDMHVIEPRDLWQRYMSPKFRDRAPVGTDFGPRDIGLLVDCGVPPPSAADTAHWVEMLNAHMSTQGDAYRESIRRGWDAKSQLDAMDREGIDVAVLFPSRGLGAVALDSSESGAERSISPELATDIARAYNDWLADFCAEDPKRMYGAAMLAPHDVDAAVLELRRCVRDFDFRSVFLLPGWVNERPWHDPHYDRLWAECQDLDVVVSFHGGFTDGSGADYGQGFRKSLLMWHTFSHSLGPMAALVSLIGGGVFDRFPRLRAAFLEGNCSWAPWLIYRLEDHYEDYIGKYEITLERRVSEYFLENCWVSVEADERPADLYIERFGDDNVVFSTDYPHADAKFPHAVDKFLTLPISDESKRKFLWDNTARLYRIEPDQGRR